MERSQLFNILHDMKGTDKELSLLMLGEVQPIEVRNLVDVAELKDSHVIKVTTKQNYIWLEASHVSGAYQARADL